MLAQYLIAFALVGQAAPQFNLAEGATCVLEQTSPEDGVVIANGVLNEGVSEAGAGSEARMVEHMTACVERFGWNEAQTLRVSLLSVAMLARRVGQARLAEAGIDNARLDAWFERQNEEFRTTAFLTMDQNRTEEVLVSLAGDVLPADLMDRHAALLGGYLAARVLAVRAERGLPL